MHSSFTNRLLMLFGLIACSAAQASMPAFDGYAAASDEDLDKMRGGFEISFNGMLLKMAFSLEQLTYINGELISSMRLNPLELIAVNSASTPALASSAAPILSSLNAQNTSLPVVTPPQVETMPPAPATPSLPFINTETTSMPVPTAPQVEMTPPPPAVTQLVNDQSVITLIQNGAGNAFTLPESLSSLTTVIQNTVNDQVIRNLTVLNATLSMQTAAAAMRLDAALNQAIAAGLR